MTSPQCRIDEEKKQMTVQPLLKKYVSVLWLQMIYRFIIRPRMKKGLMPLPTERFELIQEVANPLIIQERFPGYTVAFSFQCLQSNLRRPPDAFFYALALALAVACAYAVLTRPQ